MRTQLRVANHFNVVIFMVKLSKAAKARLKRLTRAKQKSILTSASELVDCEVISEGKYQAIKRALRAHL